MKFLNLVITIITYGFTFDSLYATEQHKVLSNNIEKSETAEINNIDLNSKLQKCITGNESEAIQKTIVSKYESSDGLFKKPFPVIQKIKLSDEQSAKTRIPIIELQTHNVGFDKGVYKIIEMQDFKDQNIEDIEYEQEKTTVTPRKLNALYAQSKKRSLRKSILKKDNKKQNRLNVVLNFKNIQNCNTSAQKTMLGKKRAIDSISNEKRIYNFLGCDFNDLTVVSDNALATKLWDLSKFIHADIQDSECFQVSKNKANTIHSIVQIISERFFLKPLFLFNFSKITISYDRIKRFNSFWNLLLMRNVLNERKLSYINEVKDTSIIEVNNTALINRLDSILNRYITNCERTLNRLVTQIQRQRATFLYKTMEYTTEQIECFKTVLQTSNEIRKISWNIVLSDKSVPSTIGSLFELKFKPALDEYLKFFKTTTFVKE